MGDTKGAAQAYTQMLDLARRIYEADSADQRARSDYAIALARMAAVLPPMEAASRIQMLRQSIQLQKEVAQINPSNLSNRSETALMYNFLGDAPLSAGDRQNAMAAYREGVRLAESMFPSMSPALARGTMMMYRKLGEHSVRTGDRGAALEFGEKARRLLDPEGPVAKSWPPETQKVLAARGTAARGHIGAALAYSVHRRQSDSEEARRWLQQALELFRAMESHPAFSAEALREMRAVQIELEKLQ